MRFCRGPSLMYAVSTNRLSTSTFSDFWLALATAERTTFSISTVALLFVNLSVINASLTFLPRIMSTTRRAFWGDILINRPEALLITRPPMSSQQGVARLPQLLAEALPQDRLPCPLNRLRYAP